MFNTIQFINKYIYEYFIVFKIEIKIDYETI